MLSRVQPFLHKKDAPLAGSVNGNGGIIQGLPMSSTYSAEILAILGEQPAIKRRAVYGELLKKLNMNDDNLTSNFSSASQVGNKVSNFRRAKSGTDEDGLSKRQRTT